MNQLKFRKNENGGNMKDLETRETWEDWVGYEESGESNRNESGFVIEDVYNEIYDPDGVKG